MPELPEVEHGRRVAERAAAGRVIVAAEGLEDSLVFPERDGPAVAAALVGRRVEGVHRHGKYLFFTLERGPHPLWHFGMSGAFRTPGDRPLALENGPAREDRAWPPRFWKLRLELEGDRALAFTNARRLGRVLLRDDPRGTSPIRDLGFDPLLSPPRLPAFRALLARRRVNVKALLLDQSFAAGVGNWIADEVLYQAGLDPRRDVPSLSDDEVARLHGKLKHVVRTAVKADARSDAFPRTWLFHRRWGRRPGATTARGEPIEHLTVAGRTTAWVPSRQR
ncbi:MAG: DNA-formamidopyrimidine glycosylase family protein [Sandaracinaceae bacterium]